MVLISLRQRVKKISKTNKKYKSFTGSETLYWLKLLNRPLRTFCIASTKSFSTEFSNFWMRLVCQTALVLCHFQLACCFILLPSAAVGINPPAEAHDALQLGGTSLMLEAAADATPGHFLCGCGILDLCNILLRKKPLSVSLNFSSWFPFTLFILGSMRKLLQG